MLSLKKTKKIQLNVWNQSLSFCHDSQLYPNRAINFSMQHQTKSFISFCYHINIFVSFNKFKNKIQ